MTKRMLFTLAAALLAAACARQPIEAAPARSELEPERIATTTRYTIVERVVDRENGVVCYVADGGRSSAIDCLPMVRE